MGIPYSREINAAFEQVTPLVAAGYKVLQTTKNISIILAIIQVLTVVFLGLILLALIVLIYTVNPDLEYERRTYITPFLRHYIRITLFSLFKTVLTSAIVLGAVGYVAWRVFLFEQWVADVEYEGNVDANQALEDMGEDSKARKKGKEKVKRDADKILEEGGK